MYYAAINHYGTDTSAGFANTWSVIGFERRQMRDQYVSQSADMATRPITRRDMHTYGGKAGRVSYYDSNGHLYVHVGDGEFVRDCTQTAVF